VVRTDCHLEVQARHIRLEVFTAGLEQSQISMRLEQSFFNPNGRFAFASSDSASQSLTTSERKTMASPRCGPSFLPLLPHKGLMLVSFSSSSHSHTPLRKQITHGVDDQGSDAEIVEPHPEDYLDSDASDGEGAPLPTADLPPQASTSKPLETASALPALEIPSPSRRPSKSSRPSSTTSR
jgi:hypothetical protein